MSIPQMIPWFDEEEKIAMNEYMASGGFLTEFKQTAIFENLLAEFTKSKHVIAVTNGTVSLWMMIQALEIGPSDSVIVPNYTMIATANAVRATGAEIIFCDVELDTLCLDMSEIESKVKENTKAIFLVTANGRYPSYGIKKLKEFAAEKNIALLEDAAQSLGSFYPDGAHIGTVGLMGSLSFSVPKIITTGQGGAILTNDDELARKLRKLKDFGRVNGGIDVHDVFGLNFKFTDLQATIGIVQMSKLSKRMALKKEIYRRYQSQLVGVPQIVFFKHNFQTTTPWFIDCLVERRNELIDFLQSNQVTTRVMYPPINEQQVYETEGSYPVSKHVGCGSLRTHRLLRQK